jgi:hypothetical protein
MRSEVYKFIVNMLHIINCVRLSKLDYIELSMCTSTASGNANIENLRLKETKTIEQKSVRRTWRLHKCEKKGKCNYMQHVI